MGGFSLPFWVLGADQLAIMILTSVFLTDNQPIYTMVESGETEVTWRLVLFAPGVLLSCFTLCLAGTSWTWYSASLQPFLVNTFGFSASSTGLIFMTFGLSYTIFTPLFGWLTDYGLNILHGLKLGNLVIAISFLFLGPIPPLKSLIGSHVWLTVLVISLQGSRAESY